MSHAQSNNLVDLVDHIPGTDKSGRYATVTPT